MRFVPDFMLGKTVTGNAIRYFEHGARSFLIMAQSATAACLVSARLRFTATSMRDASPLIIVISRSTLMRRKSALRTREKSPASIPVRLCAFLTFSPFSCY